MLKKFLGAGISIYFILASGSSLADDTSRIRDYIRDNFANKLQISEQQIQQLSWIVTHKRRTYEMDRYIKPGQMHSEVSRALTRLYCLQLLKSGSKQSYDQFIAAQLVSNQIKPLSFNSFNKLSRHIQELKPLDYELIETSTVMSAVSLSAEASRLAQAAVNVDQVSDNFEFLSATVRIDANIYPIAAKLIQEHDNAKKLLYVLFPPQTNFRHMLYTEGGANMFKYLRAMIKHQYIQRAELDLWYAYWITHIAGFRGHIAAEGSVYLTEQVFQAMTQLKAMIDVMLESPNYDPLEPYLEYRAGLLGFTNLPREQRLLLAHLGSLYTIEDGRSLRTGVQQLSLAHRNQLLDPEHVTTTYGPALFANTLDLMDRNIEQTVAIMMPIYCKAIQSYKQAAMRGGIKAGASLSFSKICATAIIKKIIKLDAATVDLMTVNADGELQI